MSDPFARVPLWILGRSDVSWAAKILYGLIARYVGKGREAWPSIETLAGDMRTSDRNVRAWLRELRDAGLVDVERTGRASTYRVLGGPPEPPPDGAVLRMDDRQNPADQSGSTLPIASEADRQNAADQIGRDLPIRAAETCLSGEVSPSFKEEKSEEIIEEKGEGAAAPPLSDRIDELEGRYAPGLAAEARAACALSRRNGKMADAVWLRTLEALAAHPTATAEHAMRTFCERYGDGEKDERYLIGIARGEAKRRTKRGGRPMDRQEPARVDPIAAAETRRKAAELFGGGPLEVANG